MTAMPANANTLACSPFSHSCPERIQHAGHFMPRNAWIADSGPAALQDNRVATAHSTRLNFDAHLSRAWCRNLQLNNFETRSSRAHLSGLHGCYCDCGCHKSSQFLFARVDRLVVLAHPGRSPPLRASPGLAELKKAFPMPTGINKKVNQIIRVYLNHSNELL